MDNGLTVPKWVLIVCPKIPQTPQNLSAQFVNLSALTQKFQISMKKASLGIRSPWIVPYAKSLTQLSGRAWEAIAT